ncbi:putative porin [uncultured Microbulbifer sp.]|uniref:putative porin n=1 Tax=uncultured Microbulbifer sp. TaxID=348147 RepID=UPI0026365822|nr:putative porin [uncultured Microbulbifer sp.]
MRFKLAALPLMLLAATATAEEYNSFTEANYANFEDGDDGFTIDSQYFFGGKETLGPLKEFEYINKVSNIYGGFSHINEGSEDSDIFSVGGEYFASNGFVLGAQLDDLGEENIDTLSIGYLFTPNFLVSLEHVDNDSDNELSANARYNHQLNGTDYIGFNFSIDEEFDTRSLSSKYFTHLGDDQYLTAELTYASIDGGDDYWKLGTEYFFTQRTSVGFSFDEGEEYKLGMNHFFSRNFAVEAAYVSNTDSDDDYDIYQIGMTVQL